MLDVNLEDVPVQVGAGLESLEGVEPSTKMRPRARTAANAAGEEVLALVEWAVTSARNWLLFFV